MNKVKVVFFGSSVHSLPVLKKLLVSDIVDVVAVVTQPDRPTGRKQIMTPTPVSTFAISNNLPIIKPNSLAKTPWLYENPKEVENILKHYQPDLFVVCYYGQRIPLNVLKLVRLGGLNIHPSLLPKYRGASPGEWAILNEEKETGVTILMVSDNFDEGKIVAQEKELIKDIDTSETLYERLFQKGANLFIKILPDYLNGKIKPFLQNNFEASFAPRLKREDGKINWQKNPLKLERMIRAFHPWPGTFTYIQSDKSQVTSHKLRLKILKAHLENGKLVFDLVQLEGKKPTPFSQFKTAYPEFKFL